jgi:hypothetical protein
MDPSCAGRFAAVSAEHLDHAGPHRTVIMRFEISNSLPFARPTRRQVMRGLGLCGARCGLPSLFRNLAAAENASTRSMSRVVKDRQPLLPAAFYALPLGSIRPRGWLLDQLRIQANGLSGHLTEIWPDVGANSGWLGGDGESWERGPYYLDGLLPLAYLLDDPRLKALAQTFIDWTISRSQATGMFGPPKNEDWWPRIVMLKALTQYQELTDDPRVMPLMDRYFRYQLDELPKRPLRDWAKFRWQDELLTILWLYNRTGSAYLLDLAQLLRKQGYDWIGEFADFRYKEKVTADFLKLSQGQGLADLALATHGVNNGQAIKCGAVWSQVSGSTEDRNATLQMIGELNRYHGLPNGMFSCDEHLSGQDPSQGSELCTVVEYLFSLERSLAITGNVALADRLEKLACNALPGAMTDDMWAHQYNQEPNQVECSLHQKPWVSDGPESNLFGLAPNFGCCTANYHQGWPKFTNSLWMASGTPAHEDEDGLVAALYAPCEVRTLVKNVEVHIVEETEYPFQGSVRFSISPAHPIEFPLHLRIPAWASGTAIQVNAESPIEPAAGSFARVHRTWRSGDRVEIRFPMHVRTSRWFHNSIALERGPLVFSYAIGEDWVKLREHGLGSADWQVFPTRPWNFALNIDQDRPEASVATNESPLQGNPFALRSTPLHLTAKARQLPGWRAEDGAANPLPQSPVGSEEADAPVTLVPYAAAKLRITAFPQLKS